MANQQTVKRAELSINIIVVVILALIILFVLVFIFSKQSLIFRTGLQDCESKQGLCSYSDAECKGAGGQVLSLQCPKTNNQQNVCCYLSCESQKGQCTPKDSCTGEGINFILYTNCDDFGKVCCFKK